MSIYNTQSIASSVLAIEGCQPSEYPETEEWCQNLSVMRNSAMQSIFRASLELIIDSARMTPFRFLQLWSWGWKQFCCAVYCKLVARLWIFRANRLAWRYRRVTNNLGASALIITYITKKQGPWNYWKICVLSHDMHWRGHEPQAVQIVAAEYFETFSSQKKKAYSYIHTYVLHTYIHI